MTAPSDLIPLADARLLRTAPLVDHQWIEAGDAFDVTAPASGKVFLQVRSASADLTRTAIAAASRAWPAWRALPAKRRGQLLRAWFDLIRRHREDLALILSAEQGKPIQEALAEVDFGASFVELYAEEATRLHGGVIPSEENRLLLTLREPIGVCAAITPWNFPVGMVTRKVAPALAAGCPVVIKPSEHTPLSALALGELAMRAGFPPGTIHVLPADATNSVLVGQALCEHPDVRHLSFTGSTQVGRLLMAQCAPTVKKLALELGGNAPFIVFDDADLDLAVEGAIASRFRNAGQTCICANRLYVQAGIHDAFVARLGTAAKALQLGPLIDAGAVRKAAGFIAEATSLGARVITGGVASDERHFAATVLCEVSDPMRCMREETFSPIAPVARFTAEDEVVARANATDAGLAAYVYTRDLGRAVRMSRALQYGMVGVNAANISTAVAPFGGVKQSGLGREGGADGIEEYTELKYVCLGIS